MSNIIADRVQETTTTTGTGTITTNGASVQCQSLSAGIGNGNSCDYCLLSGNGADWETGNGTVTVSGGTTTLSRTTIYASSNSGSAVSLTGISTVFCTASARRIGALGPYAPAMPIGVPTQSSTGFSSWLNQPSGATVTNAPNGLQLFCPAQGSAHNAAILSMAAPSTPYSFTALIGLTGTLSTFYASFLGWSDGTKVEVLEPQYSNALQVLTLSSLAGGSPAAAASGTFDTGMLLMWQKIYDDGTTVHFYISRDGSYFFPFYSVAKSAGYLGSSGYSHVIFGADGYSQACAATLMSWSQGTS